MAIKHVKFIQWPFKMGTLPELSIDSCELTMMTLMTSVPSTAFTLKVRFWTVLLNGH